MDAKVLGVIGSGIMHSPSSSWLWSTSFQKGKYLTSFLGKVLLLLTFGSKRSFHMRRYTGILLIVFKNVCLYLFICKKKKTVVLFHPEVQVACAAVLFCQVGLGQLEFGLMKAIVWVYFCPTQLGQPLRNHSVGRLTQSLMQSLSALCIAACHTWPFRLGPEILFLVLRAATAASGHDHLYVPLNPFFSECFIACLLFRCVPTFICCLNTGRSCHGEFLSKRENGYERAVYANQGIWIYYQNPKGSESSCNPFG